MARIKAVLRKPVLREDQLKYGDLILLLDQRVAKYHDSPVDLNRREFDVLLKLVQRVDTIVTRDSLLESIDKSGEIFDRTIDSHISHLRSRFKNAGIKDIKISSVYGLGYRLEKVMISHA
ncbi:MAG: winged helix-turn-helix domain-containing protein [Pseudobdellovibrionaceae bacterium]